MTVEPELRRRRGHLPLAVRLHDPARDEGIGARVYRLAQDVVELAQLVAAEADTGAVLALHPEARPAEMRGQALQRLQRCRQLGQAQAGETREARLQVACRRVMHGADDSNIPPAGNYAIGHSPPGATDRGHSAGDSARLAKSVRRRAGRATISVSASASRRMKYPNSAEEIDPASTPMTHGGRVLGVR